MISAYQPLLRYFEEKYFPVKLIRKSKGHATQMRLTVNRFEEYTGGRVPIELLTQDHIDGFKAWRSTPGEKQFVATPTLNKDLRNLRALVNFASRRGHLTSQLFFEFEAEDIDPPLAWWPEELVRVFESCLAEVGHVAGIPRAIFWQALAAVIYSTGARISTVMQIHWHRYDPAHGLLTLPAKTQKQRKGQVHPLHAETVAALNALAQYAAGRDVMFPWPHDANQVGWPTLTKHWKRILERAGLPFDRKHLFHCLRKTTGTYVWRDGGKEAAQEQLGHSAPSVTERYGDPRQLPRSTAKNLIPPPPVQHDRQLRLF